MDKSKLVQDCARQCGSQSASLKRRTSPIRTRTSHRRQELLGERLNVARRKGRVLILLEEVEDRLGEEFRDDADVVTEVEAVEQVDAFAAKVPGGASASEREQLEEGKAHLMLLGSRSRRRLRTLISTRLASRSARSKLRSAFRAVQRGTARRSCSHFCTARMTFTATSLFLPVLGSVDDLVSMACTTLPNVPWPRSLTTRSAGAAPSDRRPRKTVKPTHIYCRECRFVGQCSDLLYRPTAVALPFVSSRRPPSAGPRRTCLVSACPWRTLCCRLRCQSRKRRCSRWLARSRHMRRRWQLLFSLMPVRLLWRGESKQASARYVARLKLDNALRSPLAKIGRPLVVATFAAFRDGPASGPASKAIEQLVSIRL